MPQTPSLNYLRLQLPSSFLTVEELEDLIREGGYTYVYLRNIVDFHIEKYHTLFVEPGPGMQNNAIYRVEYDEEGQLWLNIIAQD